eukprot:5716653-Amphidinium_carterae.1
MRTEAWARHAAGYHYEEDLDIFSLSAPYGLKFQLNTDSVKGKPLLMPGHCFRKPSLLHPLQRDRFAPASLHVCSRSRCRQSPPV